MLRLPKIQPSPLPALSPAPSPAPSSAPSSAPSPAPSPVRSHTSLPTPAGMLCDEPSTEALFAIMDDHRNGWAESQERDPRIFSTDPAIHLCLGMQCPHLRLNDDHTSVCQITGVCHAQRTCNDPITAGIVRGIDENGVRTGKDQPVRWRRHDPASARRAAMSMAHYLDQQDRIQLRSKEMVMEDCPPEEDSIDPADGADPANPGDSPDSPHSPHSPHSSHSSNSSDSANSANGAVEEAKLRRRRRPTDGDAPDRVRELGADALATLRRESEDILDKLTLPAKHLPHSRGERLAKARKTAHACAAASLPSVIPPVADATRAYLRRCQISGSIPALDELHNIELNGRIEHAVHQRRSLAHAGALLRSERYVALRALAASLVVALWKATLRTPYMRKQRRAADSFKSFAAGVCLSMRRGVTREGVELVPSCEALAHALPAVRAAHRGTATHEVHLSAHKGVSCMHKCIASVRAEDVAEVFADAARASEALRIYAMQ